MKETEQLLESAIRALNDAAGHPSEKVQVLDRLNDMIWKARGVFMAQWEKQMERGDAA